MSHSQAFGSKIWVEQNLEYVRSQKLFRDALNDFSGLVSRTRSKARRPLSCSVSVVWLNCKDDSHQGSCGASSNRASNQ